MTSLSKFAIVASAADAVFLQQNKVSVQMNPGHVADLLKQTQAEWVNMALTEKSQEAAQAKMTGSCEEIVSAMVKSSDGEKDRVNSYFSEVCGTYDRSAHKDEDDKNRCQTFAKSLGASLSDDTQWNREGFQAKSMCAQFWQENVSAYAQRASKEREQKAQREAEQKRREEDVEAKRIAAQKQAEAKRIAAQKQKEKDEETKRVTKLHEAKVRAEEAAAKEKEGEKRTGDVVKKAEASLKRADAAVKAIKNKNKPVSKSSSKNVAEDVAPVSFRIKQFEDTVEAYASHAIAHVGNSIVGKKTMADTYVTENHAEPSNHSIYQNAAKVHATKPKAAKKAETTSNKAVDVKKAAAVAKKAEAIKARIEKSFETPVEGKKVATPISAAAEARVHAASSNLKTQVTKLKSNAAKIIK